MAVSAVCPGSFDPITLGHLDVIERAARRFDHVVTAVVDNPNKQSMFALDERVAMVRDEVSRFANVEVVAFEGLLVDFCRERDIGVICKGLRGVADFEYELQMAQMNLRVGDIETMFISTNPTLSYLSSSLIKEVARMGGSVHGMLPDGAEQALLERSRA
ncbi:MAG: pantetheine-phosphate adenylyltransferase [Nitriliruptoraceae bacterium]